MPPASAYYVSLADTSAVYPLLAYADTGAPIRWAAANVAQLQLASVAVRVSDRGVRFITRPATLLQRESWAQSKCAIGQGHFCTSEAGSVLFPENPYAVVVPDHASAVHDLFMSDVADVECMRHSNRIVSGDVQSYTASLCDITQKGAEVVLDTDTQLAHMRLRGDKLWVYVVISVCLVVLVTCLAQDVSHFLGNCEETPNPVLATVCSSVLFVMSWCMPAHYVVWSDVFYQWFVTVYIVLGIALWVWRLWPRRELPETLSAEASWKGPPAPDGHGAVLPRPSCGNVEQGVPFNVVIGTILLSVCRMYGGIECAYLLPVLFLLALRTFIKVIATFHMLVLASWPEDKARMLLAGAEVDGIVLMEEARVVARLSGTNGIAANMYGCLLAFDFLLLALTHQYGFRPLFERPVCGDVYLVATLLAALTIALVACEHRAAKPDSESNSKQS